MRWLRTALVCFGISVCQSGSADDLTPSIDILSNGNCPSGGSAMRIGLDGWVVNADHPDLAGTTTESTRLPNGKAVRRFVGPNDYFIAFAAKAKLGVELCFDQMGLKVNRIEWSADGETVHGRVSGAGEVSAERINSIYRAGEIFSRETKNFQVIEVWAVVDAQVTRIGDDTPTSMRMAIAGGHVWPIPRWHRYRFRELSQVKRCLRFERCDQDQIDRILVPQCILSADCSDAAGEKS